MPGAMSRIGARRVQDVENRDNLLAVRLVDSSLTLARQPAAAKPPSDADAHNGLG